MTLSPLESVQKLHVLQEEIQKHISSHTPFYLKIDDSGSDKKITVVTGVLAKIFNFFGSKKFDLTRVLDVFNTQISKAQSELTAFTEKGLPPATLQENLDECQYALTTVIDLVAFKYTEWNLGNFRPSQETKLEEKALDLRATYLLNPRSPRTTGIGIASEQQNPLLADPNIKALAGMQTDLFDPLWAFAQTESKEIGWKFNSDKIVYKEKTIDGSTIKEETFDSADTVFTKVKTSLGVKIMEFEVVVLSSFDRLDYASDPLSNILQQDIKNEFETLRVELLTISRNEDIGAHCKRISNVLKMTKTLLSSHGIRIDGTRQNNPSKTDVKNIKNARIPFLALQLLTLTKSTHAQYEKDGRVDAANNTASLWQKTNRLFKDAYSSPTKENYLQCLSIFHELQKLHPAGSLDSLFKSCMRQVYTVGLELLLTADKEKREQSHFLKDDKGMPARRIYKRIMKDFKETATEKASFTDASILIDAFLAKPTDRHSFEKFLLLELDDFRSSIKRFCKTQVDAKTKDRLLKELDAIPTAATPVTLKALYDLIGSFPYTNKKLWNQHCVELGTAPLAKTRRGLELDLAHLKSLT